MRHHGGGRPAPRGHSTRLRRERQRHAGRAPFAGQRKHMFVQVSTGGRTTVPRVRDANLAKCGNFVPALHSPVESAVERPYSGSAATGSASAAGSASATGSASAAGSGSAPGSASAAGSVVGYRFCVGYRLCLGDRLGLGDRPLIRYRLGSGFLGRCGGLLGDRLGFGLRLGRKLASFGNDQHLGA